MSKISRFEGERALHHAKKRDHARSKLPEGRRLRARDDAEEITEEHVRLAEKKETEDDRDTRDKVYDKSMSHAHELTKKHMDIKRMVI